MPLLHPTPAIYKLLKNKTKTSEVDANGQRSPMGRHATSVKTRTHRVTKAIHK